MMIIIVILIFKNTLLSFISIFPVFNIHGQLLDLKYISIEEMEELKKKNNSEYTFVKWENVEEIIEMLKKIRKEKLGF